MDAGTIYANLMRNMCSNPWRKKQWKLIEIICFGAPNIDGLYLQDADYSMLFRIAPNVKSAFETADEVVPEVRETLKNRIAQSTQGADPKP